MTRDERRWGRRALVGAVVVGSVGWAVWHRPSLSTLTDDPGQVAALVTALVVANTVYGTGLVLAAAAVARAAGTTGRRAWRAHASVRRWGDEVLLRVHRDPLFRAGFALNGLGAVAAALVPAVAVVTLLPRAAWSLLAVSALDVGGAVLLRVAVHRRLRRLAADAPSMAVRT